MPNDSTSERESHEEFMDRFERHINSFAGELEAMMWDDEVAAEYGFDGCGNCHVRVFGEFIWPMVEERLLLLEAEAAAPRDPQ